MATALIRALRWAGVILAQRMRARSAAAAELMRDKVAGERTLAS